MAAILAMASSASSSRSRSRWRGVKNCSAPSMRRASSTHSWRANSTQRRALLRPPSRFWPPSPRVTDNSRTRRRMWRPCEKYASRARCVRRRDARRWSAPVPSSFSFSSACLDLGRRRRLALASARPPRAPRPGTSNLPNIFSTERIGLFYFVGGPPGLPSPGTGRKRRRRGALRKVQDGLFRPVPGWLLTFRSHGSRHGPTSFALTG